MTQILVFRKENITPSQVTAYFVCVEERTDEDGGDSRQLCGELVPLRPAGGVAAAAAAASLLH